MNIAIIGLRAGGKTTIGKLLALRLSRRFIDLDDLTLAKLDAPSIIDAWKTRGEQAWRDAERQALTDALRDDQRVLALGGGTAMIPECRDALERAAAEGRAFVVYLRVETEELVRRLDRSPGDRPPLTNLDLREEVAATQAARDPVYRRFAGVTIEASRLSPDEAAEAVMRSLPPM